jgi:hypothetical protein
MSIKLKALGLGLLAAMAMSAVAVMNAGAETGGHFTSEASHTVVSGKEAAPNHTVKFASDGGTPIECTTAEYSGTISGTSATSVSITPTYKECRTENETEHKVSVDMKGCSYTFTVSKNPAGHNTVHLVCPEGVAGAQINHPNCTMRMPAQTTGGGVSYSSVTVNKKSAITAGVTATGITAHYEAGICVFLGTKHTATMTGAVTLTGSSGGSAVGIGATG